MKRNILNSSKKKIGEITFFENKIEINNFNKPLLTITDTKLINNIYKGENNNDIIILYDIYTLLIGEVACLYNISYTRANKYFKQLPLQTKKNSGRRNSSYSI